MLFAGLCETRKWGTGKEEKILFLFILVVFPVCLVILRLGKDCETSLCPNVHVVYMLLFDFSGSLLRPPKRSLCCHFPILFTTCTTTGLKQDQIPLYWAMWEHPQTTIRDWNNLKSLLTWTRGYLLPTDCEFQMMVVWFAITRPPPPKVRRTPFLVLFY